MADDTGNLRDTQLKTLTGAESNRTIMVPAEDLITDESAVNDDLVRQAMQSMRSLGPINPPTVTAEVGEDGRKKYRVIAGMVRTVAQIRLGMPTIQCTLVECNDYLVLKQMWIDENLIRRHSSAAERAILWGDRREIEKGGASEMGRCRQMRQR